MSKNYVTATWEDAPHLTEAKKKDLLGSYPLHMRNARSKGEPSLDAGAIYPVPESDITVDPFEIPKYWPRIYGMDVGWKRTAAVWATMDYDTETTYLFSEYYKGQAEPPIHAYGIRSRGEWIPGMIDPTARGRGQIDGKVLFDMYLDLGLDIFKAENPRESGIYEVWIALSTGKLKVFSSLRSWLSEFRIYRRDDNGKVIKSNDHLMDATRYLWMSRNMAIQKPPEEQMQQQPGPDGRSAQQGY